MSDQPLDASVQSQASPGGYEERPGPEGAGERPELRAIPVAGRQRAGDLPPPLRRLPGDSSAVGSDAMAAVLDVGASAGSSRLREDLLTNPRRVIRQLYEDDHPEWRLDRNITFAVPPAVWDTVTRHSAEIGVPAKRLMTALVVAYLTERGVAIEGSPRR